MHSIVRQLLSEKIIDDFYERSFEEGQSDSRQCSYSTQHLTERLKALLPEDQHELLFLWEAQCNETCSLELRRFADYVAELLMMATSVDGTSSV
jgi:hypothetical protein